MRIFISVQWNLDPSQQSFLDAVELQLKRLSFSSVKIEKPFNSIFLDPFPQIRQTILGCRGAIVIAFERIQCFSGIEYPGNDDAITFSDQRSSTIWNHIEGAMAYQAGLPVLVLQEIGLRQNGITNMTLTNVKIVEFRIDECTGELSEIIKDAFNQWSQSITDM